MKTETETETELEPPFRRPPKGWKLGSPTYKSPGPMPSQTPSSKKESEDTIPNTTDK